jgi:hypothetical protein
MGIVKAWMMEMEERGYGESDDVICGACVTDEFLKNWIADNATAEACSFCDATASSPIAASFEDFTGVVLGGVGFDWNEPTDEGIMYISAEGGWQASMTATIDVLYDTNFTENDNVVAALVDMIDNEAWVEREFYRGTDSQRLAWGWDSFKDFTKNNTRFFFLQNGDFDRDEVTPAEILATLSDMILSDSGEAGLIKTIEPNAELVRIRVADQPHEAVGEIGPPTPEFARQSNRMSPAGIPMFYGAFDRATAFAETFDPVAHAGQSLSIGTFHPLRPLRVLDLADIPPVPSVFDIDQQDAIHPLRFLRAFARDISQPIARDGREHIEYVPTQIVTEYFRRVFRFKDGGQLDGIIYSSAKTAGSNAFVLFCENGQCIGPNDDVGRDALLRLVNVRHEQP